MSYIEEVSWMSESGYSDIELMEYIDKHFDEIECELNGEEYKEPKKHDHYFCMDCKLRKIVDYERSTLVCTKCALCEYYPVYVESYNHMMQPSRRKCIYKRSDVIKSTDPDATYTISNISLEFDTIINASLASQIRTEYMKSSILYDRILRARIIPLNKSDTSFSVGINSPSKSLKGVLLIFT